MNEDRPGIQTISSSPDQIRQDAAPIQSVYRSVGAEFWNALPSEVRAVNEPRIAAMERYLLNLYPKAYVSEPVRKANGLSLQRAHEQQTDHESCSYHASANALRILDGPNNAYTKQALKLRLEQIRGRQQGDELPRSDLIDIFNSGYPYDKFKGHQILLPYDPNSTTPDGMYDLLASLYTGAVGIDSWPYSPQHTIRNGITYTHARTLAGFSTTNDQLFFHVVDPYDAEVKPWSFRDYIVAKSFQVSGFTEGITANHATNAAKEVFFVTKPKTPIITLKSR